jgi:hypothetical protein
LSSPSSKALLGRVRLAIADVDETGVPAAPVLEVDQRCAPRGDGHRWASLLLIELRSAAAYRPGACFCLQAAALDAGSIEVAALPRFAPG